MTALLHHVEPAIACLRARGIGRAEGLSAAASWERTTFGYNATDEARNARARRILRALDGGDSSNAELLPTPDGRHSPESLEIRCGWMEPDAEDRAAHDRWRAARPDVQNAYATAFRETIREVIADSCRHVLTGSGRVPPPVPRELSKREVAKARFLGAFDTLEGVASIETLDESEAQMIVARPEEIAPPLPTLYRVAQPRQDLLDVVDRDVLVAVEGPTLRAIDVALNRAWAEGRDAVWEGAFRELALRTLGRSNEARSVEEQNEKRLWELEDAAGPFPSEAEPYIRPVPPDAPSGGATRRAAPEGWVVEPIGTWQGQEHEAVYDPRHFQVTITVTDRATLASAPGWQLQQTDGLRYFWTRDREVAARAALDRLDQRAMSIRDVRHTAEPGPTEPPPGLGL